VIRAMSRRSRIPAGFLRRDNLRIVNAIEPLKQALHSPDAEARRAARELGTFEVPIFRRVE